MSEIFHWREICVANLWLFYLGLVAESQSSFVVWKVSEHAQKPHLKKASYAKSTPPIN